MKMYFRCLGCLVSYTMGMFFRWKIIAAVAPVVPVLALIFSFFIPESPTFLLSRKRREDATKALRRLNSLRFNHEQEVNKFF